MREKSAKSLRFALNLHCIDGINWYTRACREMAQQDTLRMRMAIQTNGPDRRYRSART